MEKLMIDIPDYVNTKQLELPAKRVHHKILKQILGRVRRGLDLIKDESNFNMEVKNDDELVYRFRSSDCRTKHDAKCSQSECRYFTILSKKEGHGTATCTCPDDPLLCKHLQALVVLSGNSIKDWHLQMDSQKGVTETNRANALSSVSSQKARTQKARKTGTTMGTVLLILVWMGFTVRPATLERPKWSSKKR